MAVAPLCKKLWQPSLASVIPTSRNRSLAHRAPHPVNQTFSPIPRLLSVLSLSGYSCSTSLQSFGRFRPQDGLHPRQRSRYMPRDSPPWLRAALTLLQSFARQGQHSRCTVKTVPSALTRL